MGQSALLLPAARQTPFSRGFLTSSKLLQEDLSELKGKRVYLEPHFVHTSPVKDYFTGPTGVERRSPTLQAIVRTDAPGLTFITIPVSNHLIFPRSPA